MLLSDRQDIFNTACLVAGLIVSYDWAGWFGPIVVCSALWLWKNQGL